jgi:hypothetical protein
MEIRIITTPKEYEDLEALTQELHRLLTITSERDLPRARCPALSRNKGQGNAAGIGSQTTLQDCRDHRPDHPGVSQDRGVFNDG